uniref:F1F0-ATP synthase delta subunit C-terminal domain-containing protein n=1 Tax=Poecilia mexicana TaxID=48701 RepID=A0A3B3XAQ4_9TELE
MEKQKLCEHCVGILLNSIRPHAFGLMLLFLSCTHLESHIYKFLQKDTVYVYAVSSGSVTVNADSSVQLLAEEAVPLDQLDVAAAKANLEKAQSELAGAADEARRAEVQINIEANEAIVKALE